jgi:hypothetical protein
MQSVHDVRHFEIDSYRGDTSGGLFLLPDLRFLPLLDGKKGGIPTGVGMDAPAERREGV